MDGIFSNSAWIAALPPALDRQRTAIAWLARWSEAVAEVTSLSVGCSIGRGAADELSDVDAAIGVNTDAGSAGMADVDLVECSLVAALPDAGEVVDVLRGGTSTTEFVIRRVFVQFVDRLQLDLAVIAEPEVRSGLAAPDFTTVYRSDLRREPRTAQRPATEVTSDQVREWAFLGWRALLDADKYLQRGSLWEAHHKVNQARDSIWRLWAVAHGAAYAEHGLWPVLDSTPDLLPPNIEATVAGLESGELRDAVTASADVLAACSAACLPALGSQPRIAAFAQAVLGRG